MADFSRYDFAGKRVLVTGAGSGIGAGVAAAFLKLGAWVIATDLEYLKLSAHSDYRRFFLAAELDTTSEQQWQAVSKQVVSACGGLDILVNNAGIPCIGSVASLPLEHWKKSIDVNLNGVFLGVQNGIALMRASDLGAIVNISSIYGVVGKAGRAGYAAAKAGVTALTKCAALDCAAECLPIRINSVHPGVISTEKTRSLAQQDGKSLSEEALAEALTLHPIGRMGVVEDVVNAVLFLASAQSGFVTGSQLIVDGGETA